MPRHAGVAAVLPDHVARSRGAGASESRAARWCTGSIAPSTRTRSATCWPSTSIRRRCCRPTTRRTGSTTSPTSWACRPSCSSATWRRPARSARSPSAIRESAAGRRDVPHPPGRVAGRAHRGAADWHGRRHPRQDDASARRRPTISRCRLFRSNRRRRAGPGVRAPARIHGGRRARAPVAARRRRRLQSQPEEHDEGWRRHRERARMSGFRSRPARTSSPRRSSSAPTR